MSNKCDPPSKNVDVLGAGGSGVDQIKASMKSFMSIAMPFFLWYYLLPNFLAKIFGREKTKIEREIVAQASVENPEGLAQKEFVEIDAPTTWLEFFTKITIFGVFMFVYFLLTIYMN